MNDELLIDSLEAAKRHPESIDMEGLLGGAIERITGLVAQRDALLAAANHLTLCREREIWHERDITCTAAWAALRAAIAEAEKGTPYQEHAERPYRRRHRTTVSRRSW